MKEYGAAIKDQELSTAQPITCFYISKLMMILVYVVLNLLSQGYVRRNFVYHIIYHITTILNKDYININTVPF